MLKARILSAVIFIPILFIILYAGGIYWWALVMLIGTLALYEYFRMMTSKGYNPLYIPGFMVLLAMLLSAAKTNYLLPFFLLIIMFFALYMIVQYPRVDINDISLSFFGAIYIGLLFSFTLKIFYLDNRFWIMVLALLLTWASDTGGYFAGRFLGRRPLTPQLSPKKTQEGALGAILLSTLAAFLFFSIMEIGQTNIAYILLLGLSASILAQTGDLMISGMKRFFEVKDTGKIIPGHGGILDRLDSFLMVVPLIYYFFVFLVQI